MHEWRDCIGAQRCGFHVAIVGWMMKVATASSWMTSSVAPAVNAIR